MLLLENGYKVPAAKEKKAYLLEKKLPKESMLKVLAMAKKDRARRKTGTDRQYEEKQEVPERTAYRGRLCRYCRLLRRPSVEYREEKEKDHGRINAGIKKNS